MNYNDYSNETDQKFTHIRLGLLGGFLLVCLVVFAGLLFHTQVVKGADYLKQSVRTITRSEKVEASRGIITDRNGKVLVSNRQSYTLTFDAALLSKEDDENAAIAHLLQLCESRNVSWEDNLPISSSEPFVYTLDSYNDTLRKRFLSFLQGIKHSGETLLPEDYALEDLTAEKLAARGLTAPALLEILGDEKHFALDEGFSAPDARKVIGVRYELEVRKYVNTSAYIMAEDIDRTMISLLSDGHYAGAKVGSTNLREYKTNYAAHILGYVRRLSPEDYQELKDSYDMDDWIGKDGAEAAFESYLKGTDGRRTIYTNAEGKVTSELYSVDPQPGSTVALTIDIDFQQAMEEALAETISKMNREDGNYARGGAAVSVEVGTGAVLGMASYPTYNLSTLGADYNTLEANPGAPMLNRATSGTYPPGSTLKPATAIAALQENKITISQRIRDTGWWNYPGTTRDGTWCWNHAGHGLVNVTEAVKVSCNYYFAEMGYRLGMDTLRQYLSSFGLGEPSGIEIAEKTGTLPENPQGQDQAPWAAYGQSTQVYTPVQLANYIATLVSGGDRYAAHLLKSVKTYDNSQVLYSEESQEPLSRLNIAPANLSAVMEGMHELTTSGSVSGYFRNCVVSVGAKTGTAQLGGKVTNNGVFVCFAPYEDPEIALAVVIEKGGSGSALASTAVNILNAYFTKDEIGTAIIGEGQLLQ